MITAHKQTPGDNYEIELWSKRGCNEGDRLIALLSSLSFLTDSAHNFSVEEIQILIGILFPTKSHELYTKRGTNNFKYLFEGFSHIIGRAKHNMFKHCSPIIVAQGFKQQGFVCIKYKEDWYMNVLPKEVKRAYMFFGRFYLKK